MHVVVTMNVIAEPATAPTSQFHRGSCRGLRILQERFLLRSRSMTDQPTESVDEKHISAVAGALPDILGNGAVKGVLEKLHLAGLGDVAKSWVGKGANLPISVDQIKSVLGSGQIASIASKLGISTEKATFALAQVLPHAIDHMTPDGAEPTAEAVPPDPATITAKMFGR
jgi:uncharacterized protein YidB (DUF937 family)